MIEEAKSRQQENLAQKYTPNGKCEEFIRMVGANKTFVNLFCAANGVGKSACGVNIVTNICFGIQNEWFNYPLFQKFPYLKRGRIISDPTTIKEKIVPELKKWFPSNRYKIHYETKKEGKQYESRWTTDTGFVFDIMSTEQDSKEFESTDIGWFWADEPVPHSIYIATIARLRLGGICFLTLTPLTYSAWIKDNIYDKRDGYNQDYVTADVEDNCKQHGTRGILDHPDIERMSAQYPEDEKEARLHGKFGHLLGLVHKGFDIKTHVIEPFVINDKDYCVYMALDTHPRVPDAVLWMAIDEKGQKYICDELFYKGTDIEITTRIKRKEDQWRVLGRLIDPSAFNDDKRTEEANYALRLERQGLSFDRGSKNLIEGIRRTDQALKYEVKNGQMIKKPEIFIFSNCIGLIKELQNYVWDDYRGSAKDERDPKGRPKDKDDHFIENLHRLLMAEFNFVSYEIYENSAKRFNPYSPL